MPLGELQEGRGVVDDVLLPPWAQSDAFEFVRLHREALESDYVSSVRYEVDLLLITIIHILRFLFFHHNHFFFFPIFSCFSFYLYTVFYQPFFFNFSTFLRWGIDVNSCVTVFIISTVLTLLISFIFDNLMNYIYFRC